MSSKTKFENLDLVLQNKNTFLIHISHNLTSIYETKLNYAKKNMDGEQKIVTPISNNFYDNLHQQNLNEKLDGFKLFSKFTCKGM